METGLGDCCSAALTHHGQQQSRCHPKLPAAALPGRSECCAPIPKARGSRKQKDGQARKQCTWQGRANWNARCRGRWHIHPQLCLRGVCPLGSGGRGAPSCSLSRSCWWRLLLLLAASPPRPARLSALLACSVVRIVRHQVAPCSRRVGFSLALCRLAQCGSVLRDLLLLAHASDAGGVLCRMGEPP